MVSSNDANLSRRTDAPSGDRDCPFAGGFSLTTCKILAGGAAGRWRICRARGWQRPVLHGVCAAVAGDVGGAVWTAGGAGRGVLEVAIIRAGVDRRFLVARL